MANALSFDEEQAILAGIQREAQRMNQMQLTAQKTTADRFAQIYRQFPMLPPGIALNMAKTGISDDTVQKIATEVAIAANENPGKMNGESDGNWLHGFVKGASRLAFATGETSLELLQNVWSRTGGAAINGIDRLIEYGSGQMQAAQAGATPNPTGVADVLNAMPKAPEGGVSEFFGSTTLKTLVDNWDKQGSGWFVSDAVNEEQAERARAFRGVTHGGHAYTFGRGLAGLAFKEDSFAYNLMSGVLDAGVALKVPVLPGAGRGLRTISEVAESPAAGRALQAAGGVADKLLGNGVIIPISELTGQELRDARRIAGLIGDTVDPVEANKFFGTRAGRRLVTRLVEADTADDVRALLSRNVYADTIKRLRDAKTEFEVQEVLADVLGMPGRGIERTQGIKGIRAAALTNARRTKFLESLDTVPFGAKIKRGLAPMARRIGDISSENPADVRNTMNALDDWMRNALVDEPTRRKVLDEALDAMVGDTASPTARKAFKENFQEVIKSSLKANGVNDEVVDAVFTKFFDVMKKRSQWNKGVGGKIDDAGFYNAVNVNGTVVTDHAFGGPMLASELANVIIDMPDVRQVRALTGRWNKIWRHSGRGGFNTFVDADLKNLAEAGKLRLLPSAAVYFQDKIFKPLVLATGGYTVRNLNEAQMRIALSSRQIDGVYNHPLSWIGWAFGKKGKVDVLGQDFTDDALVESMRVYREGVQAFHYSDFSDPAQAFRRGMRTNDFRTVDRADIEDIDFIVPAHADQLGKLNADYVARLIAGGETDDDIVKLVRFTEDGKKWFRDEQAYHTNGRKVYDRQTGRYTGTTQQVDLNDGDNLKHLISEIRARVEAQTGGDSRLLEVIRRGHAPAETVVMADVGLTAADVGQVRVISTRGAFGKKKGFRQVRVQSVDPNTGEAVVLPFAFANGEATADLNRLLDENYVRANPKLAPVMPYEIRFEDTLSGVAGRQEAWDNTVDRAFGFLYGKASKWLDRSPLFRQFYYQMAVDDLLQTLDIASVRRLLNNIETSAQRLNITPAQLLGDAKRISGSKRYERIQAAANGQLGLRGTLTLEEVDEIAKMNAVEELKRLLYDASEKSNFMDAARIVSPFANAFAEFYRAVGKAYTVPTRSGTPLPNISSLRKTQLVVEGGREADPDQNGRGFFFVDPETQEWSFTYPGSEWVIKTLAKVPGQMTAPISGAIQGIDLGQRAMFGLKLNPGLGPWATIAASKVLDYVPEEDALKRFWLPYGEPAFATGGPSILLESFLPAWLKKVWNIATGGDEEITMRGNAFFEAKQALAAGGQYDPNSADDMAQLDKDASHAAYWLSILRTAGQWLGPSRPTPEFKAKAIQGDVFVNQMMADYRKWQQEDYDTATFKFLDVYGEQFWPYLARKTATTPYDALGASTAFGKWEAKNNDLLRQYPEVAAYFAPFENQFDWQVYTRQIIEGKRKRQLSSYAFDEAQWFAANAQYRYAQRMGASEEGLKNLKTSLLQQYPGYGRHPYDVNKLPRQIDKLQEIVTLSRLDGNPVAEGLRVYLDARDTVLARVKKSGKGLGTKANAEERVKLRNAAAAIIEGYPEFGRLYERVLSREIDE